eukprot:CAMPEP_0174890044 /NCGR_PEP_ID=MMETSP0167-20121228/5220_1 /TAXON_ID=38298 /ORGANISM="Rhodella maculata, Strain CCMP736" /LENGTH=50 /DNA_ID=CAMNT_0016127685 /DNA_START=48 /DNA_END=197 /DNA_ORIENTATION=+
MPAAKRPAATHTAAPKPATTAVAAHAAAAPAAPPQAFLEALDAFLAGMAP